MKKKNITKTFSIIFIITLVVKALGLIRDIVFAGLYGTSFEADAYFAATRIPTQLVDIILSSAIVSIFVPVFSEVMHKKGKDEANAFANNFINIVAVISTVISILGILFAPQIVKLLAGGFDSLTFNLTVELIKITFPMVIFTSVAFSFVGFLQSYGEFNVPAMISGISNIFVIAFLLIFRDKFGIQGVTICMTIAWLLQVLVQLPFAKKYGYNFKLKINFKDENIKKVLLLALPIIISTAVLPINNLVSTRIASGMQDGAVSALEYSYKLYLVISGVFTYAIGNIIFPELSRANTENDDNAVVELIHKALRIMSYLLIPLTFGIIIYRKDIIETIYARGEFGAESVLMTAGALLFYSIGILGSGFVEIMNKSFYAKQDTKSPLKIGLVIILLNLLFSIILSKVMGFTGLALSTSITTILNAVILICVASKKQKNIFSKELFITLIKMIICALFMSVVVYVLNKFLITIMQGSILINILRIGIGAVVGVVVYYISTIILKVNEINIFKLGGQN